MPRSLVELAGTERDKNCDSTSDEVRRTGENKGDRGVEVQALKNQDVSYANPP